MSELAVAEERPDYQRAVQIIVYSMNGGPFPAQAQAELERAAQKVAEAYPGIAISIVEE